MSDTLVLLSGGIDLQSTNVVAAKGTLRDCLNFEVGTQAGYARIDGHMPHDGTVMGPDIRDFSYFAVTTASWNSTAFQYGESVSLTLISGDFVGTQQMSAICIGWQAPSGATNGVLLLAFVPGAFSALVQLNLCAVTLATGAVSGGTVTYVGGTTLRTASQGLLTPQNYNAYRSLIETQHIAAIEPVPGELESPVDGVFTYKDDDYAVHDCVAFYFRDGELGDIAEGHIIKSGATQIGVILSVTTTSGDWDAGTAVGYVIIYDMPPGVSLPADGASLNLWSADGSTDLGTVFVYDGVSDRTLLRSKTRALLYSAASQTSSESKSATPWQRRRLSRELGYTQVGATNSLGFGPQGDADYSIYEYSRLGLNQQNEQLDPVTTGYQFCITPTQAATAWSSLSNIQAQDGAVATTIATTGYSTWMRASEFDFSEIPPGSVITGLEVVIRRRAVTSASSTLDWAVKLALPDGTFSGDKANRTQLYPTVLTDATYGGPVDTWGVQLTRDMVNDPAFGIHFEAKRSVADTVAVDDIKVRVTYVPATRLVYIRNTGASSPTDIEARVIHYTRDTGDATTADQAGTLTLWIGDAEYQGTAAGKSRRIGTGEEIWSGPGGTGNLLAKSTGEDVPTSFPCGAAIDAKDARWQFELANFYADPDAQMVFACNGTEYAWMYDEQYSVRIRTGRRQDLDTPRHIANHLNFLHFGFDSGDIITSAIFRPLTCDPALGSALRNVGEPITGLRTMNGQTLGVWTRRAVRGFQGTAPLNYVPIVISPAVGAIEYTVTNLAGVPTWTSARGVESAATVSAYGDFQTDPLSYSATPWLQERVQFDSRIGLVDKRPAMAVAVRSKRQYRVYFRDGYVMTVTLFGIEDVPMCTVQRLERGTAISPYNNATIRHVFAGIRDDGKETLLASFDRQNPVITGNDTNSGAYPYVTRLDVGKSFAGAGIPAYIELNPIYGSIPTQDHRWQYCWTWASAIPLTSVTLYTKTLQDVPFSPTGQGIVAAVQPNETSAILPFPNYSVSFDIGRAGPFVKLRYDVGVGETPIVLEPMRLTHLVLTSEPLQQKRN